MGRNEAWEDVTGQQCFWAPLRNRALWTVRGSECRGRLNTLAFLLFPFREASQTALGVGVGAWVNECLEGLPVLSRL